MNHFNNFFDFPECDKIINIHDSKACTYWTNARQIKLGDNGNPKAVVKGQHHENVLYMYFQIQDSTLRKAEDSLTICINSSRTLPPGPENVLLGCELTFSADGRRLTCLECDNSNYTWKEQFLAPFYIDCEIKKDALLSNWNAMVKIDFVDLTKYHIKPDSFGLYIKVLDYNGAIKPANYYYPVTAQQDDSDPNYIPPHEQWAIGRFQKRRDEDK